MIPLRWLPTAAWDFITRILLQTVDIFYHEQQLTLSKKLNMKLWQADAYSQAGHFANTL